MRKQLRVLRVLGVGVAALLAWRGEGAVARAERAEAGALMVRCGGGYERARAAAAGAARRPMEVNAARGRVNVAVGDVALDVTAVRTPHGTFVELDIAGAGHTERHGAPMLPVVRQLVAVPEAVAPRAGFTSVVCEAGAEELGLPGEPLPVQPPVPKVPGALEAAPFVRDAAAYASAEYQPAEVVRLVPAGKVAGQRMMLLELAPVQYAPGLKRYRLHAGLSVTVEFDDMEAVSPRTLREDALVRRLACNGAALPAAPRAATPPRLLVIAHTLFATNLAAFVAHKAAMGWEVDITNTTIGGTAAAITNFIRARYQNVNTRPDALLLVGDTAFIPRFVSTMTDNPDSDLYYACIDGGADWLPDFPVGRFSVQNNAQLNAVIDKLITYETAVLGAWMSKAVFMAGHDNYTITEGTHNYVISTYLTPRSFTSDKLYTKTYGATAAQVTAAFNDGRVLGIYSGHGDVTYWADGPACYQSNVHALNNAGRYPFVCSFACLTGQYSADECFAETWHRAARRGAVNVWASSTYSYWDEDDILEKRLFSAIFDEGCRSFGEAVLRAKYLYMMQYGATSTTRRYFEMYNLFGDPTVDMAAQGFVVEMPGVLPTAFLGEAYSYTPAALGGKRPYASWQLASGALPDGLQLSPSNGTIYGTPWVVTSVVCTVQVTDAQGSNAMATARLDTAPRLQMTTGSNLPPAALDAYYRVTLNASGGIPPYTWSVQYTAYREDNAPSNWLGGGVAQNWRADDRAWPLTLPFAFPFYGAARTSLWVSSNGMIDFNTADTDYSNSDAELRANTRIAPLWDDLITNTPSDDIYITTNAAYTAIRWKYATYAGRAPVNVEAVLHADGRLQFNYGSAHTGLTPTIGISGGDGSAALLSSRNNASSIAALAGSAITPDMPPPGIVLTGAGELQGTPLATGRFMFTVSLQDAATPVQTQARQMMLDVIPEPLAAIMVGAGCAGVLRRRYMGSE